MPLISSYNTAINITSLYHCWLLPKLVDVELLTALYPCDALAEYMSCENLFWITCEKLQRSPFLHLPCTYNLHGGVESSLGTLDTPPPKRLLDEVLPNAIAATATDAEDDMLKTPLTGEEVGAIVTGTTPLGAAVVDVIPPIGAFLDVLGNLVVLTLTDLIIDLGALVNAISRISAFLDVSGDMVVLTDLRDLGVLVNAIPPIGAFLDMALFLIFQVIR